MIPVRRIAHATLETPDLARQVDYYTGVVGLTVISQDKHRALLGSQTGQEVIAFEQGSVPRCASISFQVSPSLDIADITKSLASFGIASDRRSASSACVDDSIVFQDPKGTTIELFSQHNPASVRSGGGGIAPLRLGHLAFSVADPVSTSDFYCSVMGFRVSDWIEDLFIFLRCGPDHHTVNFVAGDRTFMHHIAFELKDWPHLLVACDLLGRAKRPIIWGPGRHTVGHNIFIYHRDPDDHIVEFFTELDTMKDEELGYWDPKPWHEGNPLRPKRWDSSTAVPFWGLPPSDDFRRNGQRYLKPAD